MKATDRFEKVINEMDIEQLKKMALGMQIFTRLCIDKKIKHQRNAVIDFAIIAKNTYFDRVVKELKKEYKKDKNEVPY